MKTIFKHILIILVCIFGIVSTLAEKVEDTLEMRIEIAPVF